MMLYKPREGGYLVPKAVFMRRLLILLLAIVWGERANAQNFILGVPIYDTIVKNAAWSTLSSSGFLCASAFVEIDTALVNRVHGVNYYLLITGSTLMKDSLRMLDKRNSDLGPMNPGDSVLLSHNNAIRTFATFKIYFGSRSTNGQFSYAIMASGTPTSLTDTFMCKEDYRITGTPRLQNCVPAGSYFNCNLATCVVQEPLVELNVGSSKNQQMFLIYPTVTHDVLNYNYQLRGQTRFELTDGMGRITRSQHLLPGKQSGTIDISGLVGGVYYYRLLGDVTEVMRGRIIIQN